MYASIKHFSALLALGALAACNRTSVPAPVVQGHSPVAAAPLEEQSMAPVPARVQTQHPNSLASRPALHALPPSVPPLEQERFEAENIRTQPARSLPKRLEKAPQTIEKPAVAKAASTQKKVKDETVTEAPQNKPTFEDSKNRTRTAGVKDIPRPSLSQAPASPEEKGIADVPSPSFIMPVQGTIISHYGRKEGTLQNDGINIAAPAGSPIHAAEEGKVVFASERKGFGKLVLVKHKGGWVTAYAHAGRILVKAGDDIQKGQPIAEVGQSGGVDQPQLHFEMRRNKKPLNPLEYVRP